jgi:hypothetical protein
MDTVPADPTWKLVLAAILDFLTVFGVAGAIIAWLTDNLTDGGFTLRGFNMLILWSVIVAYFVIAERYFGGTIWRRIFGIVSDPSIRGLHREPVHARPTWKIVLAAILDFVTVMFGAGYFIGWLTNSLTDKGFSLNGGPALVLIAVIVAYFVIAQRFLGGTLWRKIFGIAP